MRFKELSENTVAGSIASVAMPLGGTQKRSKPEKAPKVAKGKKYGNVISEGKMKELAYDLQHLNHGNFVKKYGKEKEYFRKKLGHEPVSEAELSEQDLIVVPGMRKSKDTSFIPHEKDRRDHEVEMARSEVYAAAKDAMRIFKLLKDRSEDEGLMGWQQSYITLASDYLNSVADSMEYQDVKGEGAGVIAGGMSNFEESVTEGSMNAAQALRDFNAMAKVKDSNTYNGIKEAGHADKILNAISACSAFVNHFKNNKDLNSAKIFDTLRSELIAFKNGDITTLYDLIQRGTLDKINFEEGVNEISDFKRKELEWELRNEPKNNYQVSIDGKRWKVFADKAHAEAVARKIRAKGKKAEVYPTGASVSEEAQGLWANIHAKRERIKKGSGERMRKPGSKGAPTAQAFKDSQKTSKK